MKKRPKLGSFIDHYFKRYLTGDQHLMIGYGKFTTLPYPVPDGIPQQVSEDLANKLLRVLDGKAQTDIYITTGIFKFNYVDGKVKRSQNELLGWTMFVCDDVGLPGNPNVKVDMRRFANYPPATFIIETSSGCYQYAFLHKRPVTDFGVGRGFLQQAAELDLTDKGGLQLTKLVRLPAGINTKKKHDAAAELFQGKDKWEPQLVVANENLYDIYELAAGFGMNVNRLRAAAGQITVDHRQLVTRDVPDSMIANDESITIFNILKDRGLIEDSAIEAARGTDDGFIKLTECVWAGEHSDGDVKGAEISPAGFGKGDFHITGQFHCFHNACRGRKMRDLAKEMVSREWLVRDDVRKTLSDDPDTVLEDLFEYCVHCQDTVYDLRHPHDIKGMSPSAMHQYYAPYMVGDGDNAECVSKRWLTSRRKKTAADKRYHPGMPMLYTEGETTYINLHRPSSVKDLLCKDAVRRDIDYAIESVCPVEDGTNTLEDQQLVKAYFANIVQNPGRRLPFALVSFAEHEGTGRGKLGDLIGRLVGEDNMRSLTTEDFLGSDWTAFLAESTFISVPEFGIQNNNREFMRLYNRLKQFITEETTEVNKKYAFQGKRKIWAQFFLCTNYLESVYVDEISRRFFCIGSYKDPSDVEVKPLHDEVFSRISDALRTDDMVYLSQAMNYFLSINVQKILSEGRAPVTKFLSTAIDASQPPHVIWARQLVEVGEYPWKKTHFIKFIEKLNGPLNPRERREINKFLSGRGWDHRTTKRLGGKTVKAIGPKKMTWGETEKAHEELLKKLQMKWPGVYTEVMDEEENTVH